MKPTLQPRRLLRVPAFAGIVCVCIATTPFAGFAQTSTTPTPPPDSSKTAPPVPSPISDKQRNQATDAYLSGARMLDRRDYPSAEQHFARALQLNPGKREYVAALAITREHHVADLVQQSGRERLAGHAAQAETLLAEARLLDPGNTIVTQHTLPTTNNLSPEPWLAKAPVFAGAVVLTPSPTTKSFHQTSDVQELVRVVATGYGIRPVFDESVTHQSLRLQLDDVGYTQAMPFLLRMGHLFAVPLDPTTVIVARDTTENRQRLERQMEETIYVPGYSTEQMSDLGNVVRNIFDVKQATLQNNLGNMVIRAPEDTINAVNLTLADLLDGSSEVVLELKLYSVDITHGRTTGFSAPQQFGAYNVASQAQSIVSANQALVNQAIAQGLIPATASVIQIAAYLIGSGVVTSTLFSNTLGIFGGGITTTGVYATGGASLSFGLTSSDARALDDIQLRTRDRQAADFRIGTRYPITTATYSTGVAANASSLAGVSINGVSASSLLNQYLGSGSSQTIPQIQYEDLGMTLKTTPFITRTNAVRLKLDLKIEALAGGLVDGIPILNNRQLVSDITVNDGDTAVLLSNVNRSEARAINGIPGISELPGFQSATDQTVEADSSQLVLLLTPHIVRHRPDTVAGPRIPFTPARASN